MTDEILKKIDDELLILENLLPMPIFYKDTGILDKQINQLKALRVAVETFKMMLQQEFTTNVHAITHEAFLYKIAEIAAILGVKGNTDA